MTAEEKRAQNNDRGQAGQKGKQPSSTKSTQSVDILKMDWSSAIAGQKTPPKYQPAKAGPKKAAVAASPAKSSGKLTNGPQHSSKSAHGPGQSGSAKLPNGADAGSNLAGVTATAAGSTPLAADGNDHIPVADRAAAQDPGRSQRAVKAALLPRVMQSCSSALSCQASFQQDGTLSVWLIVNRCFLPGLASSTPVAASLLLSFVC